MGTYKIWQYDSFRSYKTLILLPREFWKHTRDLGIINIYKLKEMVVSEVCGWMVTINRHPHMQWLMSLMWHMWLNSKYTYPLYRSAKMTIKLCFCLEDLFLVLPEVCTTQKYFFFFPLEINSNIRNVQPVLDHLQTNSPQYLCLDVVSLHYYMCKLPVEILVHLWTSV